MPLVLIETSDPAASQRECISALNGSADDIPIIVWDIVSGWKPLNPNGEKALSWYDPAAQQLPDTLKLLAEQAPKRTLAFAHNIQRFFERDGVAQGLWLLRDAWKASKSTMVLLCPPGVKLPGELASDVIVIVETPPDKTAVEGIVESMVKDAIAAGAKLAEVNKGKVVAGLRGLLSAFDVEQTLALSIRKDGIDEAGLWERKIQRLRSQTGAEILIDCPSFDRLAGCANVKSELLGFINGRQKPGVVVFMDEIEKMWGGAGTDLSGVSTNMLGQWLSWTGDKAVRGFLLAGIPGSGKTWTGNCSAGQAGVPFVKLSMADLKGSLVGESEGKLRAALSAVDALAGDGAVLMIASANWVDQLTPDVMARFSMGTFFYDYPNFEERDQLWAMYMAKFGLKDTPPESEGWVGREIETACWRAYQYNRKLADVARNINPSCISQKAKLDALRTGCSGRFLSADKPGLFSATAPKGPAGAGGSRSLSFS